MVRRSHQTSLGHYYIGDSTKALKKRKKLGKELNGNVQLILTSPPFPLNNKKSYGNLTGDEYKAWFISLAELYSDLLTPDGSIVIELGNAWESGRPVQSLLNLESLLGFVKNEKAGLRLCQQFIAYNPSRLPSPAEWVTKNRIRVTDSYTHIWWMAKSDYPKADNTNILREYSKAMKMLLKRQSYNDGERPSEHVISSEGFLQDNGGSIAHNFLELEDMDKQREVRLPMNAFDMANTSSNDYYMQTCRAKNIKPHPARMQSGLVSFFIQFLTDKGDLVVDPFGGSNTTGYMAEKLERRWISIELDKKYAEQSRIRLQDPILKTNTET